MEKLTLEICFKYPNAKIRMLDSIYSVSDIIHKEFEGRLHRESFANSQLILRPMDSLTEEENNIYRMKLRNMTIRPLADDNEFTLTQYYSKCVDYLRSINIDIDNLKERGLAIYE